MWLSRGLGFHVFILGGESIVITVKLRERTRETVSACTLVGISNNSERRESPVDVGNLAEPRKSVSRGLIV